MDTTQIVILVAAWVITFMLLALVIKFGRRHPVAIIITTVVLIFAIIATLDIAGVTAIFGDLLQSTPAPTTPV